MAKETKNQVPDKIHYILCHVHRAFMQPQKDSEGKSLRKQYWLETWSEIKRLSVTELKELTKGLEVTRYTLRKLSQKVEELQSRKVKETTDSYAPETLSQNQYEEDEFLDSSCNLPVFSEKAQKSSGKRWLMARPNDKPKTTVETCQAVWTVITNRAIYIVDKGKREVTPSLSHDLEIEKQQLMVLPFLLDDKIITDPITGKPLMNLYMVTPEVKETLLWLLAQRAKSDSRFGKLLVRFFKKEIVGKEKLFEWAKKFSPLAQKILAEIP
jgi:hypothetical protein